MAVAFLYPSSLSNGARNDQWASLLHPRGRRLPQASEDRNVRADPGAEGEAPRAWGKTVKLVEVGAELDENDVPVGVYRMTGSYLTFDEEGVIDRDAWMESAFQAVSGALSDDAPVVDLKSARVKRKHRWKPTPAERAAIVTAVIGHPKATANETAVRLEPYEEEERMAPKRRELNWEARQALDDLRSLISSVQLKVGFLREEDLEGFHEAALEAAEDADDRWISPHWRTIAEQALFRSGIAEAYRTGSGEWYAAIEAYRMTQSHISEEVFIGSGSSPRLMKRRRLFGR